MAPASIQEGVDMIYGAFDLAEEYHNPVVILSEAMLGQMMEAVTMPPFKEMRKLSQMGSFGRASKAFSEKYRVHHQKMADELERWEMTETDGAEYLIVAYGMPSRAAMDAVSMLRERGEKVGLIRPVHIWPFPFKAFDAVRPKAFLAVETNETGMLVDDVAIAAKKSGNGAAPVYSLTTGNECATEDVIVEYFEKMKNNLVKERY
jgi:2-oxoglutarate ferredoxin oxidoreductase subunit alpha